MRNSQEDAPRASPPAWAIALLACAAVVVGLTVLAHPAQAILQQSNNIYTIKMAQATDYTPQPPGSPGQWAAMSGPNFGTAAQNGKSITYDAAADECPQPCG